MADVTFTTACLFKAAALIMQGFPPDKYIKVHENDDKRITIAMSWDAIDQDLVRQVKSGDFSVNLLKFKDVYLTEKAKVFKIIDEK